jgi:hypothetical protein
MNSLELSLGNKRALENHFDYNITQDIILQDTFTQEQLTDIFIDFPIEILQDDASTLAETKQTLSLNNGSNIITGDISLPDLIS